jgi:hypothetical protein
LAAVIQLRASEGPAGKEKGGTAMSHDLDGRDARNCLHCQIEKAVREAKALRAATLASYGRRFRVFLRQVALGATPSIVAFGRRILERSS